MRSGRLAFLAWVSLPADHSLNLQATPILKRINFVRLV
jgi:hypothetical protein